MLWKHVDAETGAEVRRMRRMVVSVHATVANYEYLIYWRFYTDGNIECEVRATGLMVTTPLESDRTPRRTGTMVDTRTYAPFHQHFLVAKLDLDIDGEDNTVVEVDSVAPPISPGEPLRAGAHHPGDDDRLGERGRPRLQVGDPAGLEGDERHQEEPARHEHRLQDRPGGRDPVAARSRLAPCSSGHSVIGHTLWVTAHDDKERWPAGDYPTQSDGGADSGPSRTPQGIARWIADDAPLVADRRRALVRLRHPPHHPGRGLADDAGRHHLVLAQAVRLLRRQPVDGRTLDEQASGPTVNRSSTGHHEREVGPTSAIDPRTPRMSDKQVLTNIIDGEERAAASGGARHHQPVHRGGLRDLAQLR